MQLRGMGSALSSPSSTNDVVRVWAKRAALLPTLFVDFAKNKCNYCTKNMHDIICTAVYSMFSKNGLFVIRYAFFITLNIFYDSKLKLWFWITAVQNATKALYDRQQQWKIDVKEISYFIMQVLHCLQIKSQLNQNQKSTNVRNFVG